MLLMEEPKDPQVFVSYAHRDSLWAKELSESLEAYGFRVFSGAKLLPGDNWHLEIGKALEAAYAMVVLISPAAVRSPAMQQEIQYALGAERFQGRLIPIEVEPTQDFPWVLRKLQWIKTQGGPAEAARQVAGILHTAGEPDVHAGAH